MATTREMNHILDADAPDPRHIQPGFHRENATSRQFGDGEAGSLVNFQAEPVTNAVKEARPSSFPDFRGITLPAEPLPQVVLSFFAVEARPEMAEDPLLPLGHGATQMV